MSRAERTQSSPHFVSRLLIQTVNRVAKVYDECETEREREERRRRREEETGAAREEERACVFSACWPPAREMMSLPLA